MRKVILIVLTLAFIGAYYYRQQQAVTITPRKILDEAVAKARRDKDLSKEEEAAVKIQIALYNFMAQKGGPPDTLNQLIPDYFDSIPKNPATGKDFEYEKVGRSFKFGGFSGAGLKAPTAVASASGATTPAATAGDTDFVNPNLMVADTFVYDATGKRDPFKQFDFSAKPLSSAATPLERYSLGQLRLTAVISDNKRGATAIVEDAAGKGYSIKMGAKIGDKGGVVIAIEPDRLKVLETVSDFTGKESQQVQEMKIQTQGNTPAM